MEKQLIRFAGRKAMKHPVLLGYEGDNLVERLEFDLPEITAGQTATLMITGADAVKLERTDEDRYAVDLTRDMIGPDGEREAYVRIDGAGEKVWKSAPMRMITGALPDVEEKIEKQYPTAVGQMLTAMAEHSSEMNAQEERVEQAAQRAEEAAEKAEAGGGSGSGGSTVEIDATLTQEGKAADAKATGDRLSELSKEIVGANKPNFKTIAHRGYHVNAPQNSIQSIKDAAKNGFSWVELDIHRCKDGIYVLSHDASITLYNVGVPVAVTIGSVNYTDIKAYTLDAEGKHTITTLQAALSLMRTLGINGIMDRKSGTNAEIMQIASVAGMTDHVLLSYGAPSAVMSDAGLLNKYKNVPVRVIPSAYGAMLDIMADITNPVFADVNASFGTHYQKYLNIALSCGVPILFSGCTTANPAVWAASANGAMANESLNISAADFISMITADYDTPCAISGEKRLTVKAGASITASAASDAEGLAGCVYVYSTDPNVAAVTQKTFGSNINFDVEGVAVGETSLRIFTGSGAILNVAVDVEEADSGDVDAEMIYSLSSPVTLNGTSDYIDTGVKLFDTNKSFTMFIDATCPIGSTMLERALASCMPEISPYFGVYAAQINPYTGSNPTTYKLRMGTKDIYPDWNASAEHRPCFAIKKDASAGSATVFYLDASGAVQRSYISALGADTHDLTLLIGAHRDVNGGLYRFFSGTVNDCRVWDDALSNAQIESLFNAST